MSYRTGDVMGKISLKKIGLVIFGMLAMLVCCGCKKGQSPTDADPFPKESRIVVGFSQVGAESDWRNANTESMKNALSTQNGRDGRNGGGLLFSFL